MNKKIASIVLITILILVIGGIYILKNINKNESSNMEFKVYFFNAGKADSILISNNDKNNPSSKISPSTKATTLKL